MNMICPPRDEALSFNSQGEYLPWSSVDIDVPRSSFEKLALLAESSPPAPGDLISVLLASAVLTNNHGCGVLRPLWTQEAMHRAHYFMRLVDARKCLGQLTRDNRAAVGVKDLAAHDLAAQFRKLQRGGERAVVPCALVLRDVVTDLGTLFGYPANIALNTKIGSVNLPAYKRRALVLAACELFCDALLHRFAGRGSRLIEVGLTLRGSRSACLRVADNGMGFNGIPPKITCGVAAGLADLLEADLAYGQAHGWTTAEIVFPVRGSLHDCGVARGSCDLADARDLAGEQDRLGHQGPVS
jgi:hypothetical protein